MAIGRLEEDALNLVSLSSINIAPIKCEILKQFKGWNRKYNRNITSGFVDKRQPLFHKSNQRASSGAEKPPSRVQPTSDKVKRLIACSSTNIPTESNMEIGK